MKITSLKTLLLLALIPSLDHAADKSDPAWKMGAPIVTYWAGAGYPGGIPMSDAAATQLTQGNWNLAWCQEKDLALLQQHGLRGMIWNYALLDPVVLDDPKRRPELDAFIARVRTSPALYAYFLKDEPGTQEFAGLARLVDYLRKQDPAHVAYINLLPTYANNKQLGVAGDRVQAYAGYLKQFVDVVHPGVIGYDNYQFTNGGDNDDYFLNLAMMRQTAVAAGVPILNIVQAASWIADGVHASPYDSRSPNAEELRYLVYTNIAYGTQGISYYIYGPFPQHHGGMALPDGSPTPLYQAAIAINHDFAAITQELRPLKSVGAFHVGMLPPGVLPIPKESPFQLNPPVDALDYHTGARVQGVLLGLFGRGKKASSATEAVVVNLDYKNARTVGVTGPGALEIFDSSTGQWSAAQGPHVNLELAAGAGQLIRVKKHD